jgi:hypothetical protein
LGFTKQINPIHITTIVPVLFKICFTHDTQLWRLFDAVHFIAIAVPVIPSSVCNALQLLLFGAAETLRLRFNKACHDTRIG